MKYIIFLLVTFLVSCQNNTESQYLLEEQNKLKHSEYEMILNNLMIKTEVNPQKYYHITQQVIRLDEKHRELVNKFNEQKISGRKIDSLMNDYFLEIESFHHGIEARSLLLDYKKSLIEKIDFNKSLSREKRLLLQLSIRTVNAFAVGNIIEQYSKDSFTFNKIGATTLAEKNTVSKGDIYTARVILTAIDTTRSPVISVNGSYIPINEFGEGVVKIEANKKGIHYWHGEMKYIDENTGKVLSLPFESSFKVE